MGRQKGVLRGSMPSKKKKVGWSEESMGGDSLIRKSAKLEGYVYIIFGNIGIYKSREAVKAQIQCSSFSC